MPDLKTLRDVSGLSPSPAALRDSALLMIDLQNTYREGLMKLDGVEPAIVEAKALLERARVKFVNVLSKNSLSIHLCQVKFH